MISSINIVVKSEFAFKLYSEIRQRVKQKSEQKSGALRLYETLGFVRDERLINYYLNGVDAFRLKLWLSYKGVLFLFFRKNLHFQNELEWNI